MKTSTLLLVALVPLIFAGRMLTVETAVAPAPTALQQDGPEFIGADRCRMCHRKEEQGAQYDKWQAGPHAKAFEVLGSPEAKEVASERGIDNPQTAKECLRCHVTAYNVDPSRLGSKYNAEEGVSCESCHGAGGDYYKKSTMEGLMKGEIDPASVGLVKPDAEVCQGCHNEESPTYKDFNFDEFKEKIAHPIPAETKAQYK